MIAVKTNTNNDELLIKDELYTVGQGGWSGFPPHKHDTDRLPTETRHDETYNYRFIK